MGLHSIFLCHSCKEAAGPTTDPYPKNFPQVVEWRKLIEDRDVHLLSGEAIDFLDQHASCEVEVTGDAHGQFHSSEYDFNEKLFKVSL